MNPASTRSTRRLQALAIALLAAFATFATQPSFGAHTARTLDVTPETANGTVGTAVVFTATIPTPADSATGPIEIDFEILGGSNDVSGASNPAGDSPTAPDFTCTILVGTSACPAQYIPNTSSLSDTIRAWIHHPGGDRATEYDSSEQANETLAPGATAEPDSTDVVTAIVTGTAPGNVLDCDDGDPGVNNDDDTATNPSTGDQASTNETYTCSVTFSGSPVFNANVDAEIISGPNDPDAGKTGAPDFSCTTTAAGSCTITVPNTAGTLFPGTAIVCFWNDTGNDDLVDNTVASNGADCAEAVDETENNDITDTASITWASRTAASIDIVNEDDSRIISSGQTNHGVTVRALDQFGAGIAAVNIDFYILGGPNRDTSSTARDCTTGSDGTCLITYTGGGFNGIDKFCAWRDSAPEDLYAPTGPEGDGGGCATEPEAPGDDNDGPPPFTDRGQVTWSGGASTPTQLEVTPELAPGGSVVEGTEYVLTASVKDENGNAMEGKIVNFEISGAGDPDGTNGGTPDRTCTTGANGTCVTDFTSNTGGLSTVRSWVDGTTADAAEGSDAGPSPDEPATTPDTPGGTIEPDTTDVVLVQWGTTSTTFSPFTRTPAIGVYGIDPIIAGKLIGASGGSPIEGAQVLIKRRYASQSSFSFLGTRTTGSDGSFSYQDFNPTAVAYYQAFYAGSGTRTAATSPTVRVDIRVGVIFNVSTTTPQRNRPVTISGRVAPAHSGKKITLQYLDGQAGVWRHVRTVTMDSNSRYSFNYTRNGPGFLLFRLVYFTQDSDHLWNISRNIKVTWQ